MSTCRDCREPFDTTRRTGRMDVCDHCWDNRAWLVSDATIRAIGIDGFRTAQKKIAGRGNARPFIDALRTATEGSHR